MRKSKSETNALLVEQLYKAFEDRYPEKENFISVFTHLKFAKTTNPTNSMTKYALNKISSKFNNDESFSTDFSIEHLINENLSNEKTLYIEILICLEVDLNNEASELAFEENWKYIRNQNILKF